MERSLKLNIPKSLHSTVMKRRKMQVLIASAILEGKQRPEQSAYMKMRWEDPVRKKLFMVSREKGYRTRKYSIEKYKVMQRRMRMMNTPEFYKTRDTSHTSTPEKRKLMRKVILKMHADRREREGKIEILERENDFCGVRVENDLQVA